MRRLWSDLSAIVGLAAMTMSVAGNADPLPKSWAISIQSRVASGVAGRSGSGTAKLSFTVTKNGSIVGVRAAGDPAATTAVLDAMRPDHKAHAFNVPIHFAP